MKAKDIISRSLLMHPSLFAETIDNRRKMHLRYAAQCHDVRARQGAMSQANACSKILGTDDVDLIVAECGPMVVALNVAAKLQCLPPHIRTAAAVEWDELNSTKA